MKVLILPINIASMPAITAQALNTIDGIEAKCLTVSESKYESDNEHTIHIWKHFSKLEWIDKVFRFIWRKLFYKQTLKKWINWADVMHYTWMPALKSGADLKYASKLKKSIFIEWVGSEIRNPDYLKSINPYYKKAFSNGYEYAAIENIEQSERNQQMFAQYNAIPLCCPEMSLYIKDDLFVKSVPLMQRIDTKAYVPFYPLITNDIPVIVHSPTAKIAKGTNIILPIINELKKRYQFEFKLVHNVTRTEALQIVSSADVFLDQIIGGSYGMAAMEAMSFGKPVLCYIMPEVMSAGIPAECPIVNVNPDTLEDKLIDLITNPLNRNKIGKKSRAYVEEFHDAQKLAQQLARIYANEII